MAAQALAKLMARAKQAAPYAAGAVGGAGAILGGDALFDELYPARRWVPKALQGPLMDLKGAVEDEGNQQLLMALGIPLAGALLPGVGEAIGRYRDAQRSPRKTPR
jgi:hypothetical protein